MVHRRISGQSMATIYVSMHCTRQGVPWGVLAKFFHKVDSFIKQTSALGEAIAKSVKEVIS